MWISDRHPDRERLLARARGDPAAEAPEPSGEELVSLVRRGPDGIERRLRVAMDNYEGHPYISIRLWQAGRDGAFWPCKGKGVSIRLGECEGVAEALTKALEMAGRGAAESVGRIQ